MQPDVDRPSPRDFDRFTFWKNCQYCGDLIRMVQHPETKRWASMSLTEHKFHTCLTQADGPEPPAGKGAGHWEASYPPSDKPGANRTVMEWVPDEDEAGPEE